MADLLVRLEQRMMLFETHRLQMRFETLQVGRREQAEQEVLHCMPFLCDRRERRELSAIGA